jgi:hypothetical protein
MKEILSFKQWLLLILFLVTFYFLIYIFFTPEPVWKNDNICFNGNVIAILPADRGEDIIISDGVKSSKRYYLQLFSEEFQEKVNIGDSIVTSINDEWITLFREGRKYGFKKFRKK